MWANICRICASPASYDVYDKIPIFLHANSKDFQYWQSPINELISNITGLKVDRDDGLPKNICALCISYLKHAHTFREKAIETSLSFIAVKEYKDILKGKKEFDYDKIISDMVIKEQQDHNILDTNTNKPDNTNDEDNSTNCYYKDQNKVKKRLITGNNNGTDSFARTLSYQTKSFLLYLTKLHNNVSDNGKTSNNGGEDLNAGPGTSRALYKNYNLMKSSSSTDTTSNNGGFYGYSRKRQNCDDEYIRNMSSDEYDEPEASNGNGSNGNKSNNIFSYKEKIFEEDDIMDLDELKDLMSENIESTVKEHKCSYCSRRFMFEETKQEHLKTCIDFKFAEFFDEIKNLMYIKRCKEISPHEYIRRMIFCVRKICDWLKDNLIDTTMPDLQQGSDTARIEKEPKQNENKTSNFEELEEEEETPTVIIPKRHPINVNNNILHTLARTEEAAKMNKATSFLQDDISPLTRNTPINISNNILHEIERSESRQANKMTLKKPIPILATSGLNNKNCYSPPAAQNTERLAFLEKLQNAAKGNATPPPLGATFSLTPPIKQHLNTQTVPFTPRIGVRQDLMEATPVSNTNIFTSRRTHVSPLLELFQNTAISQNANQITPLNPCARCPQCNLVFETLDALEIHNALQHNAALRANSESVEKKQQEDEANILNNEHRRIIALFENEDEF